jgi:vacuolar-type H+-ATPase subunit F/Vma7
MMPANIKQLSIVVVGDEDLVAGMRLGGVGKYFTVENGQNTREEVRKILTGLIADSTIGVIVIQEDFMPFAQSTIENLRAEKRLTPVFIGVPSKLGARADTIEQYKAFIRRFVGFEIQF